MKPTRNVFDSMDGNKIQLVAETFTSVANGQERRMFQAFMVSEDPPVKIGYYTTELDATGCPEYAGALEEARSLAPDALDFVKRSTQLLEAK